jgi:hypothetical protein
MLSAARLVRSSSGPAPRVHAAAVVTLLLIGMMLALTGCNSNACTGSPQETAIKVSQQATQRLQAKIDAIVNNKNANFTLDATDEEATSYLATYMQ